MRFRERERESGGDPGTLHTPGIGTRYTPAKGGEGREGMGEQSPPRKSPTRQHNSKGKYSRDPGSWDHTVTVPVEPNLRAWELRERGEVTQ